MRSPMAEAMVLSPQESRTAAPVSPGVGIEFDDEFIAKLVAAKMNGFSLRRQTTFDTRGTQTPMEELPDDCSDSDPDKNLISANTIELLVNGSREEVLSLVETVNLWELRSDDEDDNSVLHIAATNSSQAALIYDILPISKDVIKRKNSKGDLAFHSAAKAGRLDTLEALTAWASYDSECGIGPELLGWLNEGGDTPLHIALENNQQKVAEYLVGQYGGACFKLNEEEVSPIYLAVKAGYWNLVKQMVGITKEHSLDSGDALLRGKSVVHAAIEARNLDILREILETHENLIESYDEEGRTPLSYAALKGYLEGARYLLKKFPSSAYRCDKNKEGFFPIHMAASGGHIKMIKELHSTKHLRNRRGQSILHVACGSGKSEVVSFLLKMPELEGLINLKDEDGNTPLHLATLGLHTRVVYILTWENKIKPGLKNKDGLTALDLVEIHNTGSNITFESRVTWLALTYIDVPRSSHSTRQRYMLRIKQRQEEKQQYQNPERSKEPDDKKLIDTPLIVATLVATVTFAAGFTLPGGYKQDEPEIGMSVLPHKWAFQVFVISNTAAMYSSILTVMTLFWAYLGDLKTIWLCLRFALPLLAFALPMMSLAFMMGVYVVLRDQFWLSYVVLGIGSIFLALVPVFFIPLLSPSHIRNPVVRYLFSGFFLLLLLVCEKANSYWP